MNSCMNLMFYYYRETVHHSFHYFIYNSFYQIHLLNARCILLQSPPKEFSNPQLFVILKMTKQYWVQGGGGNKLGHDPVLNSVCYMKLDIGNYFM